MAGTGSGSTSKWNLRSRRIDRQLIASTMQSKLADEYRPRPKIVQLSFFAGLTFPKSPDRLTFPSERPHDIGPTHAPGCITTLSATARRSTNNFLTF